MCAAVAVHARHRAPREAIKHQLGKALKHKDSKADDRVRSEPRFANQVRTNFGVDGGVGAVRGTARR
eukprot:1715977-Pleurochrysis_carterae.AAC.3